MKEKSSALTSFNFIVHDADETFCANGRSEDGSKESFFFARTAGRAAVNEIGKISKVSPVSIQAGLKSGCDAKRFAFLRK